MTRVSKPTISGRLVSLRESKDLSQDKLAKMAGIDRKTINRIENGHFSPSIDTLFRICKALKVKPADFINGVHA